MKKRYIITVIIVVLILGLLFWFRLLGLEKSTHPGPVQPIAEKSFVDKTLDNMSLRDKVASLFILHTPGTDKTELAQFVNKYKPGGIILMGDNIPATTTQLADMTKALTGDKKLPILIATDEEGDTVKRLDSDNFYGALELRDLPARSTKDAFTNRSLLLKSVGINLNFGIVADVTDNPSSFIYPRVLGTNPTEASARVAAAVDGTKGITLSTIKHFPGHGETEANSHLTIPVATTTYGDWLKRVSPPFEAGIKAGADVVMFGQLTYSSVDPLPATLSKKWHDILTNNLGFKGIMITDDMVMLQNSGDPNYSDPVENSVKAINAGNNIILFVTNHDDAKSMINPDNLIDGVVNAVKDGQIKQTLIDASARKVLNLRFNLPG